MWHNTKHTSTEYRNILDHNKSAIDHKRLSLHQTNLMLIKNLFKKFRKFPCITNKCLKYPACKYKKVIDCREFNNQLLYILEKLNVYNKMNIYNDFSICKLFDINTIENNITWQYINIYFPNMRSIKFNNYMFTRFAYHAEGFYEELKYEGLICNL